MAEGELLGLLVQVALPALALVQEVLQRARGPQERGQEEPQQQALPLPRRTCRGPQEQPLGGVA